MKFYPKEKRKVERQEKNNVYYVYYLNMIIRNNKILIDKDLFIYSFAISEEVLMKLEGKEQRKAERQEKTNDQCCKGH